MRWQRHRTPAWVYWSLIGATAYVIIAKGHGMLEVLARREELAQIVPGAYGARMFMRHFIITGSALLAWWFFFRQEAKGARVMALLGALFLLGTSIVMWLSMQVSDWHYSPFFTIGYPLCALAYLTYAIRGRER